MCVCVRACEEPSFWDIDVFYFLPQPLIFILELIHKI